MGARNPSESIADYIAALRELAMNCNFGSKERLEEMLRDRLVCGVNHQGIQPKLLSEGDISYTDALALAQSIELPEDDAKKLGCSAFLQPVHYTPKGVNLASSRTSPTCYRCGGLGSGLSTQRGVQALQKVRPLGQLSSTSTIPQSTQLYLTVHVVSGTGPNLVGTDLITPLGVDLDNFKEIRSLELASPLQEFLDKHALVFSEELGASMVFL